MRQTTHRALAHIWLVPPRTIHADYGGMAQFKPHRRKPIGRPQAMGAVPSDLYDYLRPVTLFDKRRRAQKPITITDDWPEVVPITETEVRIVEAYFGDVLDELFGPLP